MTVVFKGTYDRHKKGCKVCGAKSAGRASFVSVRTYYLPSGMAKTFRVGKPENVSERDGKFLLQYDCFEVAQ